ncbi:MAG: histidinol-phosphatase [Muribaculaceae bacterium]|nr:histidinol-phosphatase [Muribaculaceae bacterium]MDE6553650.1 histidinol-phosphatase [Muribaculaceae bacterium]
MENLHSHTEFCDGRASMEEMAKAAYEAGFTVWGTSPHSPICCPSGANMKAGDVEAYIEASNLLKKEYGGKMRLLTGMEVDFISEDFGPHIDYFRSLPLDYRIGSVHFVCTKEGRPVDVDGPADRFLKYLESEYAGDLRYVVETYYAEELKMLECGGFEIIGHLDKIGDNGSHAMPDLEDKQWYAELVEKVIAAAVEKDVIIEVNTKKFDTGSRFFPSERWWPLLKKYNAKLILSTDAHYPGKVAAGYSEAYERLRKYGMTHQLISF